MLFDIGNKVIYNISGKKYILTIVGHKIHTSGGIEYLCHEFPYGHSGRGQQCVSGGPVANSKTHRRVNENKLICIEPEDERPFK